MRNQDCGDFWDFTFCDRSAMWTNPRPAMTTLFATGREQRKHRAAVAQTPVDGTQVVYNVTFGSERIE